MPRCPVPAPFLLATQFPLLAQFSVELLGLTITYFGIGWGVYTYWAKGQQEKQKAAEEKAAKAIAEKEAEEKAWKKKMEECVGQFVDERRLEERFGKVEKKADDNMMHITSAVQLLERTKDADNERFRAIENKYTQLDTVPMEISSIKIKQEVQSTEIQHLNTNITEMKREQREQFAEILGILKTGVYTK